MKSENFIWVTNIKRNWVLNIPTVRFVAIYLGIFIAFIGFLLPKNWHVTGYGLAMSLSYPFFAFLEDWLFSNAIKCPKCGFNATHGKTTNKPLNSAIAWSRLKKYKCCPKCGDTGQT